MKKTLLFLFFTGLIFNATAQRVVNGRVMTAVGEPLKGASIMQHMQQTLAVTDSLGNFSFTFDSTISTIGISHTGFEKLMMPLTMESEQLIIVLQQKRELMLEDIVVNAFGHNGSATKLPGAVTIINAATLEKYNNALSFVTAVNTVAGVKMDERSPGSYRLSIRGNLLRSTFGVRNVKVYWNGIPFTDASGNTYFNQLSPDNIGRIEIIKGPSGSMYGAGTGGVVLLESPVPVLNKKNITLTATGGSYGTFSGGMLYDASDKKNSHHISYDHQQSDGYREQSSMRRDVGNYSGSYKLSERRSVQANIFYSDLFYQTPGGLTLAELQADPSQARPAAGAFNSAAAQQAAIYLKTIYAGVSHQYVNGHWSNNTSVYGSYTDFKNPTIRNYEDKYEKGIGARTVFALKTGQFTHHAGAEYQSGFINTGVYGNRLGVKDTLQYNDEIRSRQYNVFVQSEIAIAELFSISAGVSYNNFHYGFQRLNEVPSVKQSSNFSPQVVPRVAIMAGIKKLNIYAAVSKGYSPPSIDEVHASDGIFNVQLKAETGFNYEAGIKGDIIQNKLWVDMCYYIFSLKNTIVSRRDASGADFYVNAGRTKQRGAEATVTYLAVNNAGNYINQLKIWTSYTNIHARFGEYQQGAAKYDGNKLTGTPPQVVVAGVDISSQRLYSNITYSYTSRIPLNDANTFFGDSYKLLFFKFGYKINLQKTSGDIFFSYQTSFNNPYSLGNDLNAAGNRFFNPAAPSTFIIGTKFRFGLK